MRSPLARLRFALDHRWSPDHMSEYIDRELAAAERERLERHVRDCPGCRELLRGLQSMVATLAELPGAPAQSVASAVLARVHDQLGGGDGGPA